MSKARKARMAIEERAGVPESSPVLSARLGWIGLAAVAISFGILLIMSWQRWPDVLVDSGRELYVPWRITRGDVPYRDLAVFYGPLSIYVNALWFSLFGTSLMTLALCNAALLALFVALLHRLLREAIGRWAALAGCLVFVLIFAFGRLSGMANYNYISPYSNEIVHGVMLSFVTIALLGRHARNGRWIDLIGAALAYGLVFLTKLEPFVAVSAAVAVGLPAWLCASRADARRWGQTLVVFFIAALIPPTSAMSLFATAMPLQDAVHATLGSWMHVGNEELRRLPFFRTIMGTGRLNDNVIQLLKWLAIYALVFMPGVALAIVARRWNANRIVIGVAISVVVAGAFFWTWTASMFWWGSVSRPLPVLMLGAAVLTAMAVFRRRSDRQDSWREVLRLMLVVFAGAMTLKAVLNLWWTHYGFVLAMPATVMLVGLLVDSVPTYLDTRGWAGWAFRSFACGVIAAAVIACLLNDRYWYRAQTESVGLGGDRLFSNETFGPPVNAAVMNLRDMVQPGQTLAVLPEGVMINYLARIPTSTPYLTFLPPDLAMFGEEQMLNSLKADPPTFIVLVHRNTREFGPIFFWRDYGYTIREWIEANYRPIALAGDEPFTDQARFGIKALRHIDVQP